ncbi:MAG: EAL domain-containing protein [Gammaproteobacteria bacterium]|nr:EAL domain-containing protein [Gammaproteobacteria bacterium]
MSARSIEKPMPPAGNHVPPGSQINTTEACVQHEIGRKLVYLVENDTDVADDLVPKLSQQGYEVQVFNQVKGLPRTVNQAPPVALIMDVMLTVGRLAGLRVILNIQKDRNIPLPVIFTSAHADMTSRLAAVRANGDAYFTKPINVQNLLGRLNELTTVNVEPPPRILIVDDTGKYANGFSKILRKAEMQVAILDDPMRVMDILAKFSPALVLINTQLSALSGLELAMVIRQQERNVLLPIVFFAQAFDQTLRRAAMHGIADDFLGETVSEKQLLSTVRYCMTTAEQRNGRFVGNRDPMTGLYNRHYLLAHLDLATSNKDEPHPLAVLCINLDNYHGIDNIMGLAASDTVIMDSARLLHKQIVKRDLLAHFSENVFVIVSYNRPLADVRKLAESIRNTLEHHVVEVAGQHILTTCSIGIGLYCQAEAGPKQALADAGTACAEAAKQGGNRIQLHDSVQALKIDQERQDYWRKAICQAIEKDEFYLAFQPIASLHGEVHEYYDVLLRMHNERIGENILASDFLPTAEKSNLIMEVDHWVIERAVSRLAKEHSEERHIQFFVRIAGISVCDPTLLNWMRTCMGKVNLAADTLILDLSQPAIHEHLKDAQRFVSLIKSMGCRFSIREFDGKPNSYQLLELLQPDFIKIDGDLIRGLADNSNNLRAIQSIVDEVHSQGSTVIAPFVEDVTSLNLLWNHKADYIAGDFVQAPAENLDYDFSGGN